MKILLFILIIIILIFILKGLIKIIYKSRITPTMRFILAVNATAFLHTFKTCIDINCNRYNFLSKKFSKYLLDMGWGIKNKEETINMINWLFLEGHNKEFIKEIKSLSREELESLEIKETQNVLAWDLCRVVYIAGGAYLSGYIKYEEAINYCVDAFEKLQQNFTSWDNMMDSYLLGVKYWSGEEQINERLKHYEKLKNKSNSLYSIPWNTKLDKNDIIKPRIF